MTHLGPAHGDPATLDPSTAAALAEARGAVDRGDASRAHQLLDEVAARAPDLWEVPHLRGILSARQQEWAEAERFFRHAHSLNPTHPAPLTNLGNLRTEQGQYEEAIMLYEQALAQDPEYPNAHHNLAVVYRRLGRLDEAVRHLKRAQRLEGRRLPDGRTRQVSPVGWLLLLGALAMLAAVFSSR